MGLMLYKNRGKFLVKRTKAIYSTVTLLARLRGLSTSNPLAQLLAYYVSCSGMTDRLVAKCGSVLGT